MVKAQKRVWMERARETVERETETYPVRLELPEVYPPKSDGNIMK